jgi:dGTP triphosphohydrolase
MHLFQWYVAHPEELPARFQGRAAEWGVRRSTADYLAGMTDRFLEQDHGRRLC